VSATVTVERLWLDRFRAIDGLDLELGPGLTVFVGSNAQGKTTLLEAVTWVARNKSFRGVPDHVLVQAGWDQAIVRADVRHDGREQLFEAEIRATGRNRVLLNRSAVSRRRDLQDLLRVSVFAPDDLELVKGGPAHRRNFLDDLLATLAARYEVARSDYERILKHRNALLRSGFRANAERATLDVFDDQLVVAGAEVVRGRLKLLEQLGPEIDAVYRQLATDDARVDCAYRCEWSDEPLAAVVELPEIKDRLRAALERWHTKECERRVTLVGPHRDELYLALHGLDARHYASQGEQRTLALALRLAGHGVVTDITGTTPVLLLDDVFSELDEQRSAALVACLPPGQTLLTTAGVLPRSVAPERTLQIVGGKVLV
jgi:DNA replication and repair protein RecF